MSEPPRIGQPSSYTDDPIGYSVREFERLMRQSRDMGLWPEKLAMIMRQTAHSVLVFHGSADRPTLRELADSLEQYDQ